MAQYPLCTANSTLLAPSEATLYYNNAQLFAQYSPKIEDNKTRLILKSFLSQFLQAGLDNICQNLKGYNIVKNLASLTNHLVFHNLAYYELFHTFLLFVKWLNKF